VLRNAVLTLGLVILVSSGGCAASAPAPIAEAPWPPQCRPSEFKGARLWRSARHPDRATVEGWVDVKAEIDAAGHVVRAEVRDSFPTREFDRAALDAVRYRDFYPIENQVCGTILVREVFARKNGQIAEKLSAARGYFERCEFTEAANEARAARGATRNPQVYLEAALLESAAIEVEFPELAEPLLARYASLAPDVETVAEARERALRYLPDYCRSQP
jgi:TonB family protein